MIKKVYLLVLISTVILRSYSYAENNYRLLLSDNSPVTTGATVILNATVVNLHGVCITDTYTFVYEDDAFPIHRFKTTTKSCEATFHIPFDGNGPSEYRYKVDVSHEIIPFLVIPLVSERKKITITENLNGQLELIQNNNTVEKNSAEISYISTGYETVQKIALNQADNDYLNKTANSTMVHWFIDCIYQGNSTDFTLISNYTIPNIEHEILGVVVASMKSKNTTTTNTPITPVATTSTNTNFSLNTTLSNKPSIQLTHLPINLTNNAICKETNKLNLLMSSVQINANQKYGYFSRSILAKEPISNIKSEGKVWIEEGDLLKLQVSCNGSGPFKYCAHYVDGPYNVSGNETCLWERDLLSCQMHFVHLFRKPTNYTLVLILVNDVSKVVTPIGINIYKVKKQPQISVIVVPVTFSSIAVIIIVFGIAYYFQNRSRYMVEVADFDFANNSDMECKTFMERLRDAISQAINRTQDYSEYDGSEEQIGGLATPKNQKYGSMQ